MQINRSVRSPGGVVFAVIVAAVLAMSAACGPAQVRNAPSPFSAEQIRAATQDGRTWIFAVTDAKGATAHRVMRFDRPTAAGATLHSVELDTAGRPLKTRPPAPLSWAELPKHATYPAAQTVVRDTVVHVPAGRFRARHYVVSRDQQTRAWFARNLPGPPVRFELFVGKRRIMHMVLIDHRPGGTLSEDARSRLAERERFGPVWLGRAVTAVVAAVGEPASKTPIEDWDATGERISTWTWPAKGLTAEIDHSADGKPTVVSSYTLDNAAPWRSLVGVGIGSTAVDVRRWYGRYVDNEASNPERFVAGSVYGGVVFGIDKGKVTRVFVGASAE